MDKDDRDEHTFAILNEPWWISFYSHPFTLHSLTAFAVITAAAIPLLGTAYVSNSATLADLAKAHEQTIADLNGRLAASQREARSHAAEKQDLQAKLSEAGKALRSMQPVVTTFTLSPQESVAFFGAYTLRLESIKKDGVIAVIGPPDSKSQTWQLANRNVYVNVQWLGCMLTAEANDGLRTATVTTNCPPTYNTNEYTVLTQH
ncbi:hypothetical protein [Pararhizobium sp. DWP3-4]|uniref:hypothetical protein n=1 Tax=Pararhizobium sp. DWP3-4 TaxID=2804565 RepID=UPI003CF20B00